MSLPNCFKCQIIIGENELSDSLYLKIIDQTLCPKCWCYCAICGKTGDIDDYDSHDCKDYTEPSELEKTGQAPENTTEQ